MTAESKSRAAVLERNNSKSNQIIQLYAGVQHGIGMPPAEFITRTRTLDRNLIFFRDPCHQFYHGRISVDLCNIDASIRWQKNNLEEKRLEREVYCAGTSSGAYASILFGHYLEVDAVYAFGAVTAIFDELWVDQANIIPLPEKHQNLSRLLENWNGKTKYHLYFAEEFLPDVAQAQNIEGLPGVNLHPLPGRSHSVFDSDEARALLPILFPPSKPMKTDANGL